jgi:hypothetical protein
MDADVEAPHRHHHTGNRWFDITLAGSAIFISLISLFVAIRHGTTMERLVEANTWPNITYGTGNEDDAGNPVISLTIKNTGVGPARIDSFELFYDGKAMATMKDVYAACCAAKAPNAKMSYAYSVVADQVLPAREKIEFFTFPAKGNSVDLFNLFNIERFKIAVRACYCSVFEECWIRDTRVRKPERVKSCPAPKVPFESSTG